MTQGGGSLWWPRVLVGLLLLNGASARAWAEAAAPAKPPAPADPTALEFFEKEVRPLLVARCQTCHGEKKQKGELRLDSIEAILAGGRTGPAIVPGKPGESLLIEAINYGELYQMPPKSKLPPREIATLTRWVELGAPWPAHAPARAAGRPSEFDLKARARHWSFQPLRPSAPPPVMASDWPASPIDRYILAALEARGLAPAPEADRRTLIRRVTFDLIGLPPTPAEVEAFVADRRPGAYERLVDRLLASPHYGERWARHWLDLVRFAETAGHEFDYDAPDAYRYRDYVVRAFNNDVPYDQLVVEHVAGDLLDPPRTHPALRFNESVLGTGFFFLGEGTHSPVDLREDEAARVDNQIDVLSKAFLGLTVACARCHDHKFDPITTKDYYALYGYLQSSRHHHAFIDPPERFAVPVAELERLKEVIRSCGRHALRALEDGRALRGRRTVGALRGLPRRDLPGLVRGGSGVRPRADPRGGFPARGDRVAPGRPAAGGGPGAQRARLRPARGGAPVADVHDRAAVHPLSGGRTRRPDQPRHRRLREDPLADLRGLDVRGSLRPAPLVRSGREHVARPPRLHRAERRWHRQLHERAQPVRRRLGLPRGRRDPVRRRPAPRGSRESVGRERG
jgi:cytochrome c553